MDRSRYDTGDTWGTYSEVTTNTPGFQKLKKGGLPLPLNSYFFSRIDGKSPFTNTYNGVSTQRGSFGFGGFNAACDTGFYQLTVGGSRSGSWDSRSRVHQIVSNKLNQATRDSPIDLGVSLGEYRETAGLVAGAMKKTFDAYKALKRHNFSDALKVVTGRRNKHYTDAAKAAADAWLGYTYGVKPLMNDVYGAMERLQSDKDILDIHVVRASHRTRVSGTAQLNGGQYHGLVEGSMRGKGKYTFYVENPLLFTLDQIGVINPLSLGWELIPLSFVVDWFIPIGGFLRGVVPPPGIHSVSGYTYVKAQGLCKEFTDMPPGYGGWVPAPGWKTGATSKEFMKDRKVFSGFPSYHLMVPDLSLNKSQIMSGLSLLTQLLKEPGKGSRW